MFTPRSKTQRASAFAAVVFPLLLATPMLWAQETPPPTPAPAPAPAPTDAPPSSPSRAQQVRRLAEQVASQQSQLDDQQATIKRLEEQMKKQEAAQNQPPNAPQDASASASSRPVEEGAPFAVGLASMSDGGGEGRETSDDPRKRLLLYGYVQGQFQTDGSSQDAISQDGKPLNQNRFLVPRARLVAEREWGMAGVLLELDGNTLNGPSFGLQRAEASILYRGSNAPPLPPLLSMTLGQFRVPFGDENLQSPGVRYFMERSVASRAMFPSEIDLGLRVAGAIGWFRYQVAATNGQPLGTTDFPLQDPDSAKDVGGRIGAVVKPAHWINVEGGFSSLIGRGFHKEAGGVKSQVQWADQNGDGILQAGEVSGVDAIAARPSSTYRRFAIAFDGSAAFRWSLGETQASAAFYLGNNMDRGFFFSDPVLLGRDTRHVGYMLSLIQEVGDWVVVGIRTDYYNPDSDSSDFQNAKLVQPNDKSIRTYSPLIGLRYQKRARLLFQYDVVRDKLGRDEAGIPTDLKNDRMTVRMQVNL